MEKGYPTLRRPKRKLCYLTEKESPSKQWVEKLTLKDVDKMFDDMDSSPPLDVSPPSPELQSFDTGSNQSERNASPVSQDENQKGPKEDVLHPAMRSCNPEMNVDLDIPFKAHGPVKTSSPIDQIMSVEKQDDEKDKAVSPILFPCDDEEKEEATTEPPPVQKPQCNGQITQESNDSDLESPPSKVNLIKMSSHKKDKASREENTEPPVLTVRQEPKPAAPKTSSESVQRQTETSTRVGKDMTAFLQKLKDAAQPKPSCSRKSLSPVEASTPPEPEDDFLILEDDTPLWVSIPRKPATSKKQKLSRTSSTDKDSSTDKETKDSPHKMPQKQQESEKVDSKLESQTVDQKKKKKKKKWEEKNNEVNNELTESGNDKLPSPQDLPADHLVEQEKPNKKKLKKPPLKVSNKAEDRPEAGKDAEKEKFSRKAEIKAHKSSETTQSTSSKDREKEKTKTGRAKSLKGTRRGRQGCEVVQETAPVDDEEQSWKQSSEEHAETEDMASPIDEEILKSEADGKSKQNKQPVSKQTSSEDDQAPGKRKRKQTGQWWLSNPQNTEETESQQPTVKKSKQHNKEPSATEPSSVKAKKDKVLKKTNQPLVLSGQHMDKVTEKKPKKKRNTRKVEVLKVTEAEQEQQEVPDQDQDQEQSSPLVLTHRDHSLNTGGETFHKAYHRDSRGTLSVTPKRPGSPRQREEQLRRPVSDKRRRKPPGDWWAVNDPAEDLETLPSQPPQIDPKAAKPRKERKRQKSKQNKPLGLSVPKNGNMKVSSTPLGGTPVTRLIPDVLKAPKAVKRPLETFKDIFTSAMKTPSVISSTDTAQNNRRNITSHGAGEISVTDCMTGGKTDDHILDAGECRSTENSPNNHSVPQDSKCQSNNMLNDFRSGPSSMIQLEDYEENDDIILPSSRYHCELSVSDLCAPPLKPLTLQSKDKANLTEWFKNLWSTTGDSGAEITPDQFDWYFYQDRAIGFQVDLNRGSICNGKILLGSHMKKPLWVDHSATTVFNLLTGSVRVTIDGSQSLFSPGQSFMVQCGHAYSLQNVNAQPAVLYFTRILAESSD